MTAIRGKEKLDITAEFDKLEESVGRKAALALVHDWARRQGWEVEE